MTTTSLAAEHDAVPATFATSHAEAKLDMVGALRRMASETGRKPMEIVKDFFALSRGPGKLAFEDYVGYRLFDGAFIGDADKRAFVGKRRNQLLMLEANFRSDWLAMADDKIACASYLAAYGLPTVSAKAIVRLGMSGGPRWLLATREQVAAFLADRENYPLFGKPIDGHQSLGSVAASSVERGMVTTASGVLPVETIVDDVCANYAGGYVFQNRLLCHSDLRGSVGPGLSTVRAMTMATGGEPRVFAAGWKIIAGGNLADNFWRPGNILGGLDLASGLVTMATTGTGFAARSVERHPDTGAPLAGITLPDWARLKDIAVEGHKTFPDAGVIGWDIGMTDRGPVIVEANVMPDLLLVQAANRRGVLNEAMNELLALQKSREGVHMRRIKATR